MKYQFLIIFGLVFLTSQQIFLEDKNVDNQNLNDEYEAHNNMNMGNFPKTVPGSPKALWKFDESSKENNMRAIMNAYPHLSSEKLNNHVEEHET